MNLRDLEYLVAVADHRHFGEAAAACFVSQPTLSTQIKKLEGELGVELVERTPRAIHLTAVGERVVETAREILAGANRVHALAHAARDPEAGSLRLGVFPTLAPYLLPHVVPALHERFPHLELLLREEKSPVLVEDLREGRLDVALMAQPQRSDLAEAPLFREEFVLAVPLGHPLGGDAPLAVSDLEGEDVLLLDEGHCLRDQALSVCHLAGARERRGFRATSLETLRQMVVAGVGVTLLPRLALRSETPAALVLREFSAPVPRRDIALYWRPHHPSARFFATFADTLREALPSGVEPHRDVL
ncbi:MAG: LysR family transcriptional regulator [Acidobacteria bacterium]|nr:LysR family transcriptional regulator [Acidobacteriota bacterium]